MEAKLIFCFLILAGVMAQAGQPNDDQKLANIFRQRASRLVAEITANAQANSLCSGVSLHDNIGPDALQIQLVDHLTYPKGYPENSGLPIPGNYDAWTRPGDMQLLRTSWLNYLNQNQTSKTIDPTIDFLILHEIYRTTGGQCNDDNFVISSTVFPLIEAVSGSKKIKNTLVFTHFYWALDSSLFVNAVPGRAYTANTPHTLVSLDLHWRPSPPQEYSKFFSQPLLAVCDQDIAKSFSKINCLLFDEKKWGAIAISTLSSIKYFSERTIDLNGNRPMTQYLGARLSVDPTKSQNFTFNGNSDEMSNRLKLTSEGNPFVAILDDQGHWSFSL